MFSLALNYMYNYNYCIHFKQSQQTHDSPKEKVSADLFSKCPYATYVQYW